MFLSVKRLLSMGLYSPILVGCIPDLTDSGGSNTPSVFEDIDGDGWVDEETAELILVEYNAGVE